MQYGLHGAARDQIDDSPREKAAYAAEDQFWDCYQNGMKW